jgi:hypothetical protein
MSSKSNRNSRWLVWSLVLIVLFGLAPLLVTLAAGVMASALGCSVNEGGASGCIFMGQDIGETLSGMFVFGWLMFLSFPAAAIAFVVWLVVAAFISIRRRRAA